MYENMSDILHERKVGDYLLEKFTIGQEDLYAIVRGILPGNYIRLTHRGEVVMSDTGMEKRTNANFVKNAHGNVLIGGLGIGMILLAIQDKIDVDKIVVVEKSEEVIELVKDQLPLNNKVEIVNADVWEYVPPFKFNTIYMDIWNYINTDVYKESMKPLISRYRKFLVTKKEDSNRYIDCWCRNEAKNGDRI
jgi:hypothetical protein